MGRPPKFDRDQAVGQVMQALWSNGYEACSVKAVSEKLGITRSSYYHAFGCREALFREALDRYLAISPDRCLAAVPGSAGVRAHLTAMFREICRMRAADPEQRGCLAVNSLAELVGSHPVLGPELEAAFGANIARIRGLLAQAARDGEIPAEVDLDAKALAVKNLLVGLNVMSKLVRDEDALWALARETLAGLGLYAE